MVGHVDTRCAHAHTQKGGSRKAGRYKKERGKRHRMVTDPRGFGFQGVGCPFVSRLGRTRTRDLGLGAGEANQLYWRISPKGITWQY